MEYTFILKNSVGILQIHGTLSPDPYKLASFSVFPQNGTSSSKMQGKSWNHLWKLFLFVIKQACL